MDDRRHQDIGIVTQSGAGIGNNETSPQEAVARQPATKAISVNASYLQKNRGGSARTVESLRRK